MSKIEQLKKRIQTIPKDFTYREAKKLMESMGFEECSKGKTSGSRVKFYRSSDESVALLHKPHPGDEMKQYAVKQLVKYLEEIGELK
ncbi:HicA toxin of toxin-antitoxin [Eubacterium aggregans]|uniref:HicA toxin of toxin-antitoxin n=1 Tax=Eubacterium aggregans TaxID=81409 RepID=A0A1H3Y403_9FIRM|nr:type II toxin-antitoxin system HicA family toxin [Eubacterium aggregans]SEA06346.1 HicA toxin of toxin-antitoxin [Eubacterium aggregans]